MRGGFIAAALFVAMGGASGCFAGDNELSEAEKADGWILLFNGKDHSGWRTNMGNAIHTPIEEGCLQPHGSGGYLIVYERPFADFILRCDVKTSGPPCNSGVFFRVGSLRNPIYTGLEMQVLAEEADPLHRFGAIYDLAGAAKDAAKPPGEWNQVEIRCEGPLVVCKLNGEEVSRMNCDAFDKPGRRPDGTRHKFLRAIKDFPRVGHLGFQDHGQKVWFKNVRLKELFPVSP